MDTETQIDEAEADPAILPDRSRSPLRMTATRSKSDKGDKGIDKEDDPDLADVDIGDTQKEKGARRRSGIGRAKEDGSYNLDSDSGDMRQGKRVKRGMQRPQQGEGEEDARGEQAVKEQGGSQETKEVQGSGSDTDKDDDPLISGVERRSDQKEKRKGRGSKEAERRKATPKITAAGQKKGETRGGGGKKKIKIPPAGKRGE